MEYHNRYDEDDSNSDDGQYEDDSLDVQVPGEQAWRSGRTRHTPRCTLVASVAIIWRNIRQIITRDIFLDFATIVVFVTGMSVREEISRGTFTEVGPAGKSFTWCEHALQQWRHH